MIMSTRLWAEHFKFQRQISEFIHSYGSNVCTCCAARRLMVWLDIDDSSICDRHTAIKFKNNFILDFFFICQRQRYSKWRIKKSEYIFFRTTKLKPQQWKQINIYQIHTSRIASFASCASYTIQKQPHRTQRCWTQASRIINRNLAPESMLPCEFIQRADSGDRIWICFSSNRRRCAAFHIKIIFFCWRNRWDVEPHAIHFQWHHERMQYAVRWLLRQRIG